MTPSSLVRCSVANGSFQIGTNPKRQMSRGCGQLTTRNGQGAERNQPSTAILALLPSGLMSPLKTSAPLAVFSALSLSLLQAACSASNPGGGRSSNTAGARRAAPEPRAPW